MGLHVPKEIKRIGLFLISEYLELFNIFTVSVVSLLLSLKVQTNSPTLLVAHKA